MHSSGFRKDEILKENRSLKMLLSIANAMRDKSSLNIALKHCLAIICVGLHCPVGHIYIFDDENSEFLKPSDIWFLQNSSKTPALHSFTMNTVVRYHEDIVGRVISSREPCLIEDVCQDQNFLRTEACRLDQLHGAMAFPIYLGEKITFVMEFFTHEYQKNDKDQLLLLNRLSTQMSHSLLDRTNIEELDKKLHQLRFAVGSGEIGVWEYNPNTHAVSWDEQMYLIYGVVPHEFNGTYASWEETLHPEDREQTAAAFNDALIKKHKFDTNFRIITPAGDVRCIHANAVVKRSVDGAPENVFGINVDITKETTLILNLSQKTQELEKLTTLLQKHAYFDSLTGLINRFFLEETAGRDLIRCDRTKSRLAVLFVDLDDFKKVNDSLGHNIGDLVLFETASRLKKLVRRDDLVGRLGGDEFVVVLMLMPDASGENIAQKILKALNRPFLIKNQQTIQISASIGIAYYPEHGSTFSELVAHADAALINAKSSGKNKAVDFGVLPISSRHVE